jgi:poly(3-hydroxybutyrate) depolymerase
MLYQLYESQRALMAPFADFAAATAKLYKHPLSPFTHVPGAQRLSAGFELLHRLGMDYEKPAFEIDTVKSAGVEVAVQEQTALEKPFCRLIRFKRFTDEGATLDAMKHQPNVLLVAPLSGHHATLVRDTVKSLLQDHKVYVTDWTDARMVPADVGPFHLDDYVAYIQEFIGHIGADVHVISVCQPTVPVLAAISLLASAGKPTPLSMTMMGGPIDARKSPTAVNNLAMNRSHEWFENNVIYRVPQNYPGAQRPVYPGFLQHTGFVAMNPDRHATSHYDYFLDLVRGDDDSADAHRKFYDEYNAVLDLPAEYYLDTIRVVFQDFSLVKGTWEVNGHLVRPQDIENCALLTVEGELDDISGAGQTKAAHDLCTSIPADRQFHYDVEGAGHYGIFAGRRWRDIVYPQVRDFIKRFQTERLGGEAAVKPAAVAAPLATPKAVTAKPAVAKSPVVKSPVVKATVVKTPAAKAPVAKAAATKGAAKPAVARKAVAKKTAAKPAVVEAPGAETAEATSKG